MTVPTFTTELDRLLHRVAAQTANCKRNDRIRARADEIVSQHTPALNGAANALRNPGDFIDRCNYRANRNRLLRMAETELRCLDYAMEYWWHDYDEAVANLTKGHKAGYETPFTDVRWQVQAGVL
jgi:hypothetical protein